MELNLLKHSLFYYDVIFNEEGEASIDVDITLPDYHNPIKKILKCKTEARITSKGMNGQTIFVDGTVFICILYVDDEDCIQSFEHVLPISKTFDIKENIENYIIDASIKNDYINCRAVSQDKLQIKGSAVITVCVKVKKHIEILSDIDGDFIQTLKDVSPAMMPMGQGEKNLIIEEEISIGNGQASVEKLLRYDVVPIMQEFKVINNKVITKGNLKVYILYTSHDNKRTHNFSVLLPFSQIVDIEGVNEDCKCDCNASVIFCELKQRTGDDECRSFILTAKLSVNVNAYCESEIPLIYDAYSIINNINTTNSEISVCSVKESFSDKFIAKKGLEFSDGSIGTVIDMWCDCQKNAYKYEGKLLIVSGSIIVHLLTYDVDGVPGYFERPIDFEYRYEPSQTYSSLDCKNTVNILNSSFTIMSANQLEFLIELSIFGSLFDTSKLKVVSDIEVLEGKKENNTNSSGITIYFAQSGERLWDIAKHYNSCMDEIKNINNYNEDVLHQNKSLIIPNK